MGSKKKPTWGEDGWGEWGGYMNAKIQKLQQQYSADLPKYVENQSTSDKSSIFRGIAIFVNGYTVPSADGLKRLMMLHGGIYDHYYRKTGTTHIVATNLATATVKGLSSEKIVRPEWITDSIKAGHLLPYQNYQLLYQKAKDQRQLPFRALKTNEAQAAEESASQVAVRTEVGDEDHEFSSKLCNSSNVCDATIVGSSNENVGELPNIMAGSNVPATATVATPAGQSAASKSASHSRSTCARSTMCATNSNFLSEFYGHSRLHYLSTMGAEFRDYVNQLRTNSDVSFPGRIRIKAWKARKRLMSKKLSRSNIGEADISNTDIEMPLLAGKQHVVMHIDMDCFFVSVGIRDRPELKGKPVVVAHSRGTGFAGQTNSTLRETELEYYKQNCMRNSKSRPNRLLEDLSEDQNEEELCDERDARPTQPQEEFLSSSEIACCSYEARQAGLRNGMFLGEALKLCPTLQTIAYNFEGYREVSYALYDTIASYTHNIEAVSCDELYVDCSDILHEMEIGPMDFASILRKEILEKTRCSCSAGLSSNMLLARLATRKAKPNGQYFLSKAAVGEFMSQHPVKDLPGVGWSLSSRLKGALNVSTCGDLQKVSLPVLQKEFGPKTGQVLYNACRGVDDRQVKPEHQRKSVSAEVNYGIRFTKNEEVEKFIYELSEEVAKRLNNIGMKGKTLTLKLKVRQKDAPAESSKFMGHGICDSITKSVSFHHPVCEAGKISQEVMTILRHLKIPPEDMRGVGIQMQRLDSCSSSTSNNTTLLNFFQKSANTVHNEEETYAQPGTSRGSVSNTTKLDTTEEAPDFSNSLPPPSQLDPEVLSALPEDLRQQILEDYAGRGVELNLPLRQQDSNFTSESSAQQPDVSAMSIDHEVLSALPEDLRQQILQDYADTGVKLNLPFNKQQDNCTSLESTIMSTRQPDVPAFSVDNSFFQALPPEIQEEVREMLRLQQSSVHQSPPKKNALQLISSPEKHLKTPPKAIRSNPLRRGRKPKSGTKKNLSPKMDAQQPKLLTLLKGTRAELPAEAVNQVAKTDSTTDAPSKQKANLCGAVELQDVKQLIQEWVASYPNPEFEDVETISRYLRGLIMERNLERVDLVAKYVYRVIVKTNNQEWKAAYSAMLKDVQKLAVMLYEAPLKMPCFSAT